MLIVCPNMQSVSHAQVVLAVRYVARFLYMIAYSLNDVVKHKKINFFAKNEMTRKALIDGCYSSCNSEK